jgi:hypothetical protein
MAVNVVVRRGKRGGLRKQTGVQTSAKPFHPVRKLRVRRDDSYGRQRSG